MKKLFFLAIPLLAAGLVVGTLSQVNADEPSPKTSSVEDLKEVYDFNTILEIPTLEKDGHVYSSVLVKPDGSGTKLTEVLLDQVGTYYIRYTCMVGDKPLSEEYTFIVKNQYFSFSGLGSYAKYEEGSEIAYGKTGLFVSLASGETMTFTQQINMNGASKKTDFFKFFAAPLDIGKTDFMELDITLTDAGDSANYLKYRCKASQEGINAPYTYIDVGGNGQDYAGLEKTKIHTNSQFGCPVHHSYYGYYPTGDACGSKQVSLAYDASENSSYTNSGQTLIANHSSSEHYSSLWDGFKTGYVNASIKCSQYVEKVAQFVITNMKDTDLTASVIEDTKAPTITVDCPYAEPPYATVGDKYPIFKATAVDNLSGNVEVTASAYYFEKNKNYMLTVEDGYFDIEREGTYKIIYKATDAVGNTASKTLQITTSNDVKDISIIPLSQLVETSLQGVPYELPKFKISGGSGNFDTKYEVTCNGKVIPVENGTFVPEEIGSYLVKFTATDIRLVSDTYEYNLVVAYNEDPVLQGEPELPRYLLSGYANKIPEVKTINYSKNKEVGIADVVINEAGKTTTVKSGETYTPNVSTHMEDITLTYKAGDYEKTYTLPCAKIFEDKILQMERYFVGNNYEIDVNQDSRSLITPVKAGNLSVGFINPLPSNNSSIILGLSKGHTTFSGFVITFTDKLDSSKAVSMRVEKDASNNIMAKVNDELIKTDVSFLGSDSFKVGCTGDKLSLLKTSVGISAYDDGTPFDGFPSGMVYISVSVNNAKDDSEFFIEQICNQTITYLRADRSEPIITVLDDYGGFGSLGQLQETIRVTSCDVLDPCSSCGVTVVAPDKSIVKDITGKAIQDADTMTHHQFISDAYGQFIVNFSAKDSRGNESTFAYSIGVMDDVAPTIELTSSYEKEITVGSNLIVPTYKVTDDYDQNPKSYVNIVSPSGIYYPITGKCNSMKVNQVGVYKICITALDASGNIAQLVLEVNVK